MQILRKYLVAEEKHLTLCQTIYGLML